MEALLTIYIALTVFGVGLTLADLVGVFERRGVAGAEAPVPLVSALRLLIYFSLGAGPIGLVVSASGGHGLGTLAWSAGSGILVALLARLIGRATQRRLESSFQAEEFLLEEGVVTVPVAPGLVGKAEIRKYGVAVEVFIRAADPAQAFARGGRVRIIDYSDECYLVEPAEEEHQVR